ncbi:MAG: PKD domain-containing protein [Thermoanaerobaculia bacterium]
MTRIAGFLLAVLVAGCDASNPVAPVEPPDPGPSGEPVTINLFITVNELFANGDSTLIKATVANTNTAAPPAGGALLTLKTDLGNFGLDEMGDPIQLVEKALVQGKAKVEFFPGSETGAASILAKFGEAVVQITINIVDPGDPPKADFTFEANGFEVIFTDTSTGTPTAWSWKFGDGSRSTDQNPFHRYTKADTFRVRLKVSNPAGASDKAQFVAVERALQADFEATAGSGLSVIFTDKSMGNPSSWLWKFGDGKRSTEQNPIHVYDSAGEYIVKLEVRGGGETSDVSKFVTAGAEIMTPEADFEATAGADLVVIFEDKSTNDPTAWLWDFGDEKTSTEQNPTHKYEVAGQYTVSLTATNSAGSNKISKFVDVGPPMADFTFVVTDCDVAFTDASTGSPESWSWNFGDGGTSEDQDASHTYTAAGTYTVTLTVSSTSGTSVKSRQVAIAAAPSCP